MQEQRARSASKRPPAEVLQSPPACTHDWKRSMKCPNRLSMNAPQQFLHCGFCVAVQAAHWTARCCSCPARRPPVRCPPAGGPPGGSARRPAAHARAAAATPAPIAAAAQPASTGRERAATPNPTVRSHPHLHRCQSNFQFIASLAGMQ